MTSELSLLNRLRLISRLCAAVGILVALAFAPFGGIPLGLQVVMALVALTIGIPHGAVDHLITLPNLTKPQRVFFLVSYLAVVALAIWGILSANVLGFQLVVLMSAIHFGLGDAAFVAELAERAEGSARFPKLAFGFASGFTPVLIPLVSTESSEALTAVNPMLVTWAGGLAPVFFVSMAAITLITIIWMLFAKRNQEALDLALLLLLVLVAPPLVAFAFYFGLWHALRHTGRVSLELKSSRVAHASGQPNLAFWRALLAGLPALVLVICFTIYLGTTQGFNLSQELLWYSLVVVWALTVPHMALTLRLDFRALAAERKI